MKNYLFKATLCLIAFLSFGLTSCSNDEDPMEGGDQIEINGVTYNLSGFTFMGSWNENTNEGKFSLSVDNKINGVTYVDYYTFTYNSASSPQVGDDFAQMNLALTPLNEEESGGIGNLQNSFRYTAGKAIVTGTNPSESEISIKFEQLKMSHDGKDYVFNGNVTLLFKY